MTEKRFESRLNKDIKKFHALNPVWDNELKDAWNVFEMIDLLNNYDKEYKSCYNDVLRLEKENEQLKGELGYLKAKNGSLEEGLFKKDRCIVKLEEETQQLKDLILHMGYTIKNENGTITLELKR